MTRFLGSLIAQIVIIVGLPLMIVIAVCNCIHRWCIKQCKGVW